MKYIIRTTPQFDKWLKKLKDPKALKAITLRLAQAETGNLGDVKNVGDGVFEMRIFIKKGYRLYFALRGEVLILMLCGGSKGTQQRDIQKAKKLCQEV